MARLARIIIPHYPHHIIQRGNRRQDVFFKESDYLYYITLLKQWCEEEQVEVLAYCLMTNHVHLMLVPSEQSNLSRAVGKTHRRYTRMINFRENWKGYLWQGRFSSYVLDENWLLSTMAHSHQNLTNFKHLKPSVTHGSLAKSSEAYRLIAVQDRNITPDKCPAKWLH